MAFKKWVKTFALIDLIKGLRITWSNYFQDPITAQYPEVKRTQDGEFGSTWGFGDRFRGLPVLTWDYENDYERCIACDLCAMACPADCISLTKVRNAEVGRNFAGEFYIDAARCTYCAFCVEACPKDAIRMSRYYELAVTTRHQFVYDKQQLIDLGKYIRIEDEEKPAQEKKPAAPAAKAEAAKPAPDAGEPVEQAVPEPTGTEGAS